MQSQHAWIMAQQSLSPLVQVMQTPFSVASHLHIPIVRLQQQTIIPFIIMQQLHIPPAIIVQRFCSMPAETLSSQTQVIFMPPVHFSKVIVQRGTIIMFMPAGVAPGVPIIPGEPGIAHARHAHPGPLRHHRSHDPLFLILVPPLPGESIDPRPPSSRPKILPNPTHGFQDLRHKNIRNSLS